MMCQMLKQTPVGPGQCSGFTAGLVGASLAAAAAAMDSASLTAVELHLRVAKGRGWWCAVRREQVDGPSPSAAYADLMQMMLMDML